MRNVADASTTTTLILRPRPRAALVNANDGKSRRCKPCCKLRSMPAVIAAMPAIKPSVPAPKKAPTAADEVSGNQAMTNAVMPDTNANHIGQRRCGGTISRLARPRNNCGTASRCSRRRRQRNTTLAINVLASTPVINVPGSINNETGVAPTAALQPPANAFRTPVA